MHSKIFQVEKEPVEKYNMISEYDVPEWFLTSIADYVDDVNECYVTELQGSLIYMVGDEEQSKDGKLVVTEESRKAYLKKCFDYFNLSRKEYEKFLETHSEEEVFEDFCKFGMAETLTYRARESLSDKFGYYIYSNGCLETLGAWLRYMKPGTYYLGSVIDYHF